ncbi:MAG: hypothetical protein ACLFTH_00480 [Candidatus Woesearchaeota archaeon]
MTFSFCPECGSLLKPVISKGMTCSCGYENQDIKSNFSEDNKKKADEIAIVPEINPLASEDHICSKCGYDKARLIVEKSDGRSTWCCNMEGSARYVCGKCGFSEKTS